MSQIFHQVALIGVGLIGGSLSRALKKHNKCELIIGYDKNEDELTTALSLGVIDRQAKSVAEAVCHADLVIIAVPMCAFENVFQQMKGNISEDTVITDVGSAKASVIAAAKTVFGKLPVGLVPGHPIAGTEKSGVSASFDHLFENRRVILTPTESTSVTALNKVNQLWTSVGAEIVEMTPEHHDQVLAATSHLPHVLAFSLVDTLDKMQETSEIYRYAAGGFRDISRIASSDPTMWRDICLNNKDAILVVLKKFEKQLKLLEVAIENQDDKTIFRTFEQAKISRDKNIIN